MIPAVRNFVQDIVGTNADPDVNPMTAIAEGAAIAAAILTGKNPDNDFFVSTEHALGTFVIDTDVGEIVFSEIIPKSHKLPARATQTYYPVSEDQTAVSIDVVEGDPAHEDFVVLKEWSVDLVSAEGERGFDLTYEYDISGILTVSAVDQESGQIILQDDVAYGIATDKGELASLAKRSRDAVATGTVSNSQVAPASDLLPESAELVQKAEQLVIPYLDADAVSAIAELVSRLRTSSPENEAMCRNDLSEALQPYSFLF